MAFRLAACLLLAAVAGCGGGPPWFRGQEGPLLDPVKVSELRPGCYCEIDMVVPPTASDGSFDCFKGTVKEITHDEVVLTSVVEERCVHYGANPHPHPLMQRNRDLVRVPLTGVETIWALPPGKDNAAASASSPPAKLPASGPQAAPPPAGLPSMADYGSPAGANHFPPPPLSETPARFDAPPNTVNTMLR